MFWIGQLGEIRMKRFWMMTAFCAFLPLGQAQAQVQAQQQAAQQAVQQAQLIATQCILVIGIVVMQSLIV